MIDKSELKKPLLGLVASQRQKSVENGFDVVLTADCFKAKPVPFKFGTSTINANLPLSQRLYTAQEQEVINQQSVSALFN